MNVIDGFKVKDDVLQGVMLSVGMFVVKDQTKPLTDTGLGEAVF